MYYFFLDLAFFGVTCFTSLPLTTGAVVGAGAGLEQETRAEMMTAERRVVMDFMYSY